MLRQADIALEGSLAIHGIEHAQRRPFGIQRRRVASRQRERQEMQRAFKATRFDAQKLTTPGTVIDAKTGAVPGHRQTRRLDTVLGHTGKRMGVMMLYSQGIPAELVRQSGRTVIRVQVMDYRPGFCIVESAQTLHRLSMGGAGGGRIEITNMRAQKYPFTHGQGDGVLEMPAHPQHRVFETVVYHHRQGRVTTRATQQGWPPTHQTNDRIVAAAENRPVVNEKHIGDTAERIDGFTLVSTNGFVDPVTAGGNDGKAQFGHQQVVQGRTGQHNAEVWITRRNVVRHRGFGSLAQQDDRGGCGRQQRLFFRKDHAVCPY